MFIAILTFEGGSINGPIAEKAKGDTEDLALANLKEKCVDQTIEDEFIDEDMWADIETGGDIVFAIEIIDTNNI